MTPNTEVIHAYRHLYRNLLQAVQHARPARFIARDQLRRAFREDGAQLNREGIKRTIWFLKAAAKERGLEHQILKNLLQVRGRRDMMPGGWKKALTEGKRKNPFREEKKTAFDHYDMTVAMLNKTMGLCLR